MGRQGLEVSSARSEGAQVNHSPQDVMRPVFNFGCALFHHSLLLLTLRHSGRGLPAGVFSLWLVVLGAASLVAFLRWETLAASAGMALTLSALAALSLPLSSAFALISVAVDLLTMATGLERSYALAWELLCYGCIAGRLLARRRKA